MTNVAYDLSRFDIEKNKKVETAPKMEVVHSASLKRGTAIKGFVLSIFVFVVLGAMLLSMANINELSSTLAKETQTLNELKSESVVLQTRLDSQMSLANVEDYAKTVLGMQKLETSQMQCINVKTDNVIVSAKSKKGFFDMLSNSIDSIMEYLKF